MIAISGQGEKIERLGFPALARLLGLEIDADFDAVRGAWRRLAKSHHPDVKPGDTEAIKRFQAIQAAYDVLRAAEERRTWKPD